MRLPKPLAAPIFIASAIALSSCAVVRIEAPSKDDVEVRTHLGIVSIVLKPGASSVVVESVNVGAIHTFEGLSLGYRQAQYAALAPNDCRIVLWIKTSEELKALDQFLRDHAEVCAYPSSGTPQGRAP